MEPFEQLLREAAAAHGHLCPGQVLGVRMALAGCREVGVQEPKGSRSLIVWVEIDRCATDAVSGVTGCKLGKRTLKYVDYGKMAATFLNTATGRAVRVVARDDARNRAWQYAVPGASKEEAQLQAYGVMPEEELFVFHLVEVALPPEERPGHPVARVACQRCGEGVNDRREVMLEGRAVCRACAYGAYYETDDSEASHLRPEGGIANLPGVSLPGAMPRSRSEGRPGLQFAALVLAGGRGRRMGTAKPFAP